MIGAGYGGLTTAVCLAERGHDTVCVDVDDARVRRLTAGIAIIDEPDLPGLLEQGLRTNTSQARLCARVGADTVGRAIEPPMSEARVTVLGLTFKANTSDVRDSPALTVCAELAARGAQLTATTHGSTRSTPRCCAARPSSASTIRIRRRRGRCDRRAQRVAAVPRSGLGAHRRTGTRGGGRLHPNLSEPMVLSTAGLIWLGNGVRGGY